MLFFMLLMYFLYCQGKGFVDCSFLRSWFRYPFAVAILFVICLVINLGVNPDQVMTWLFLKACKKVDITEEKHVVCRKYSRSLCVCFFAYDDVQILVESWWVREDHFLTRYSPNNCTRLYLRAYSSPAETFTYVYRCWLWTSFSEITCYGDVLYHVLFISMFLHNDIIFVIFCLYVGWF